MSHLVRHFINHLFDIGVIGLNSIKDFLNYYDKNKDATTNMRLLIVKVLYEYFANLNDKGLETMCFDIFSKFNEYRAQTKNNSAKILIDIYQKFKLKSSLKNNFGLWKKQSKKLAVIYNHNQNQLNNRKNLL
jgi:hypothetical protein